MVGYLGVVEDALVRVYPAVFKNGGGMLGIRAFEIRQRFLDRANVVLGQAAGIGTRVGQYLVLFIQRLSQTQRVLG